jgi:nicotinate phosphoribosyltransferase
MNLLHYQTMVASKAARMVLVAPDRLLVDFGLRRAHGAEAGLLSARASFLAGFGGTATVAAGRRFGIPIYGTMAHSYVQVHGEEAEAFEHFARAQPDNATLLIDTYDTERAATRVVALARRLAAEGIAIRGVRIDSGDLAEHARRVRSILDADGFRSITIFASGNLDEYRLRDLVAGGAPIDGFGVGTRMNTSADAPYLDCAYKLEEYDGRPRRKRSEGKATWPGRKQVYRRFDPSGRLAGDTLALVDEQVAGTPLLEPVVRRGRLLQTLPTLEAVRERTRAELARLPEAVRSLDAVAPYPVDVAPSLRALAQRIDAEN